MGIELGYLTLCNMPVRINDTTPVPQEGEGSLIWSTLDKDILRWDGMKWIVYGPNSIGATTRPSIRPSLFLAFANSGILDPRITFSRNSTATRVNKYGLVETVAANVPRFEYDPVTHQPKGLLIEEARTNLVLYSSDPSNAVWTKLSNGLASAPVITPNYALAPDGTMSACRVQLKLNGGSTINDYCRIFQPVTITNGSTYTNSIYVKTTDGSTKTIQFKDDIGGLTPTVNIIAVNGNWQRINATAVATSTQSNACSIWLRGTAETSDNADLLVWNGQLESGISMSSPIPTVGSAVTRAAESAIIYDMSWFNASEGSVFVEADTLSTSSFPAMFALDDGTSAQRASIFFNPAIQNVLSFYRNSGTQYSSSAVPVTAGTYVKAAFAMKSGNFSTAVNGTLTTPNNTGVIPTGTNRLVIGGGDSPLNGHIKRLVYYPMRLSDIELNSLTV